MLFLMLCMRNRIRQKGIRGKFPSIQTAANNMKTDNSAIAAEINRKQPEGCPLQVYDLNRIIIGSEKGFESFQRERYDFIGNGEISKMKKKIPKFKSEAVERLFWQQNDSSEYIDWDEAEDILLPNLKPSTRTISIRLPESMIDELKLLANKRDVPYQSLLKIFLSERINTNCISRPGYSERQNRVAGTFSPPSPLTETADL